MRIKKILIGVVSASMIMSSFTTYQTSFEKNFQLMASAEQSEELSVQEFETDYGIIYYSVSNGKAKINSCAFFMETDISVFTIPAEVNGYPVTELGDEAFAGVDRIEGIIVPEYIEKIGQSTFRTNYNDGLKWVRIENANLIIPPDSEAFGSYMMIYGKDNSTIQKFAYKKHYNFKDYEKIVQDGVLTGEIVDGTIMITECDAEAVEVTIPEEINGIPVTAIGSMAFYDLRNLKSVYVPDSVTEIYSSAFYYNVLLSEVRLPEGLTEISENCFSKCTALQKIDIPQTVTKINSGAFSGCTALENINIPENVTYIGSDAFSSTPWIANYIDENNLVIVNGFLQNGSGFEGENLIIPDGVKYINSYAFRENENIKTIVIPEGVEVIEDYCFSGCTNLTSVSFPETLEKMGSYAFSECSSLNNITLPNLLPELGYATFENCTSLTEINIPDSITDITSNCFDGCSSLTKVSFPDNLKSIGYMAFQGCVNLESIYIPDSVEIIESCAFSKCSKIESVVLPESLKMLGDDSFFNCSALSEISFSQGKEFEIGCESFKGTAWLEKQRSENTLIIINNMLLDGTQCTGDVVIPDGITYICGYAFKDSELTSISVPYSVQKFGRGAFFSCENLTEFTIPDGITEISDSMFMGCSSLTNVNIPESVKVINRGAFEFCDGFTEFTVPESVERVGMAFDYCDNLKIITFENPDCSIAYDGYNFFTMPYNTIVRGYADSTAYWYAYLNNREFEEIYKIGDSNADGKFSVADITVLQNWLLNGDIIIKSWKSADIDNNDVLNVVDFVMIKRKLLTGQY